MILLFPLSYSNPFLLSFSTDYVFFHLITEGEVCIGSLMAREKRHLQMLSSSATAPIPEAGDHGRVTRSRSRASAADVHTQSCSSPDIFKPRKRSRVEAAAAAWPSLNAEGTEQDDEQSYGPNKEEAGGDDVVDDGPSGRDVVVISDDHDDQNEKSDTTFDANNSNHCGGEDDVRTDLTGSAASQGYLETIQTTLQEVSNAMSSITTLLEEVQPTSHASPMEALSLPSSLQEYSKGNFMTRKKRLLQMISSSTIAPITELSDQGRVTRSRSRTRAANVHTELCSLPDTFKPSKRDCVEAADAAVTALSSPKMEGTEEGLEGEQSCGYVEVAAFSSSPCPNVEGTEEVGEQSHGPSKEAAVGNVLADDPSDHDVAVILDDHGDQNDKRNTTCDGNNSNPCSSEDNVVTSLAGSTVSQESLETIQTTLQEVANVMSAITTLLEEVQPTSHSSPLEALSSPSCLQEYSKDSANHSRRKRGPTRALDVLLLPKGQKIKVMNNELGQAIGDNANKLSSFMGTVARNGCIAPLTYKDWRMMPQTYKDKMWNCVLEKFDIDKCMRRWVMMSLSTKWKKWKASLKKEHYDTHETDEERLADHDERVLPDQWTELVRFWSSEEGTKLCERNKANREKLTCIHTMGTKSFARLREEEKARTSDGSEPSRVEFFIKTHQKRSGQPVDDKASKIIAEFNKLLSELPEDSRDKTTQDNIFAQVMGRDQHGRVRTYGLGPVPSDFYGPNSSHAESAARSERRAAVAEQKISDLNKRIEEMQQENEGLQQENQQLRQDKEKAKQEERSPLEKQLEEMWQESVELLLGNDKLKEAEEKISNLQRQMGETLQENQQLRQENENMKKQIKKMMDILTSVQ